MEAPVLSYSTNSPIFWIGMFILALTAHVALTTITTIYRVERCKKEVNSNHRFLGDVNIKTVMILVVGLLLIWCGPTANVLKGGTMMVPNELNPTGEFAEPMTPTLVAQYVELASFTALNSYVLGDAELAETLEIVDVARVWAESNGEVAMLKRIDHYREYMDSNNTANDTDIREQILSTLLIEFVNEQVVTTLYLHVIRTLLSLLLIMIVSTYKLKSRLESSGETYEK